MSKFLVLLLTFAIENISGLFVSEENNVLDMRRFCFDMASRNFYLPSYSGKTSAYIIHLSSESVEASGCNLNFRTSSDDFQLILVMEFPENFRCKDNQIVLQDDSTSDRHVCANISAGGSIYAHGGASKRFSLTFGRHLGSLDDFKVTVSSAATLLAGVASCEAVGKVSCGIEGATVCVDGGVECDGHPNCGVRGRFDEDISVCGVGQKKIWHIVACSASLISFCCYLLYRLTDKLLQPIERQFFVLDAGKDSLKVEPQKSPPQVRAFREEVKDTSDTSSSNGRSDQPPSSFDVKVDAGLVADSLRSSTVTDWNVSTATTIPEAKPRKVKKKRWPVFSKAEMPQYEKRLSDQMKMRMLSSTSEDDKPKITFYAATTKLS